MDTFAPVAEYRGVAILEKSGNVRSVWDGYEYFTDGITYIWFHDDDEPGLMGLLEFDNERDVKASLDECLIGERLYLDPVDGEQLRLFSYGEVIRMMYRNDKKTLAQYLKVDPVWKWDEMTGAFVFVGINPPPLPDGQHRHKKEK